VAQLPFREGRQTSKRLALDNHPETSLREVNFCPKPIPEIAVRIETLKQRQRFRAREVVGPETAVLRRWKQRANTCLGRCAAVAQLPLFRVQGLELNGLYRGM
jgi:hypothetical protein